MIVTRMTRKDLEKMGFDKAHVRKMVKDGVLKESWGKLPGTNTVVRAYEWTR